MTKTVPIVVPLSRGIKDDKSEVDASSPGVVYCENVDFVKDGEVRGRPSFVSKTGFGSRILDSTAVPPLVATAADTGVVTADNVPFNFTGMFRYRDLSGDKPAIAANGRAWTWEGDRWADRLYVGSARVDRLAEVYQEKDTSSGFPAAVAYNYMSSGLSTPIIGGVNPPAGSPMLSGITNTIENVQPGANRMLYGGSCSATDASFTYHCTVGHDTNVNNNLYLVVRRGDEQTLTSYTLATDCIRNILPDVRAACCCTDTASFGVFGVPTIWVAYLDTGGAQINVKRVRVDTGAVLQSGAFGLANLLGFWISVNSTPNTGVLCYTVSSLVGVRCIKFNATTLVFDGTTLAGFDPAAATIPLGPVVVGLFTYQGVNTAFVAYTRDTGTGTVLITGRYFPVAGAPTTAVYKTYGGTGTNSRWAPFHQPVMLRGPNRQLFGTATDRIVLGIHYTKDSSLGLQQTGTWFSLDISDMSKEGGQVLTWGTKHPGLLAMGPVGGTLGSTLVSSSSAKPHSAQVSASGRSYRFQSWDFANFNSGGGLDPSLGINEVSLISPRAASIGNETVISGSVPHSITKGLAFDTCFPMESPEFSATVTAGGGLVVGSYSLQCVWKYVDEAGNTRRSAPSSVVRTVSTTPGNQTITLVIQNCQLTNKEPGEIWLEVYSTDVNPVATSIKTLQSTRFPATAATTTFAFSGFSAGGLALYTNNGAILQNLPVSSEGGITVANRRMWVSDGSNVFASKKFKNEKECVAWSDEGPLTVRMPSASGRVLALESLEDKVIILCQNGVYFTQGDGPEDSGLGPDFLVPVQISDVGVSNECGSIYTRHGVIYHASNVTSTDTGGGSTKAGTTGYGGLYLIQKNLEVKKISKEIQEQLATQSVSNVFATQFCELAYLPERDLLFVNRKGLLDETFTPGSSNGVGPKLLVISLEDGAWSLWTNPNGDINAVLNPGSCVGMVGAAGSLWGIFDRNGDFNHYAVGSLEGYPGIDASFFSGDTTHPYTMLVRTNHIYGDGQRGTGWARVRSVTVLGNKNQSAYTETVTVTQDELNTLTPTVASVPFSSGVTNSTWPVGRDAPEHRLANQKCSQIQVQVEGNPARGRWNSLLLSTIPKNHKAPAGTRQ